MPLAALVTLDGRKIPLGEIEISKTIADFGLPPGDVAAIVAGVRNRDDVGPGQVTASQIGSGARELYLKDTIDYAREPKREIAALLGTMRHSVVNVEHEGLLCEQRVVSKAGRFSMKYDTYIPSTGVLRDAKFPNVFKVIMILKHGVEAQARDYVLQLNLGALLLRQKGNKVTELWLDFRPTGVGLKEKLELESKYGITDPSFIPISAPFLPEAEVWDAYERLWRAKNAAMTTGVVPPLCTSEQTWGEKKCTQGWCAVASECHALAMTEGIRHPLDKLKAAVA